MTVPTGGFDFSNSVRNAHLDASAASRGFTLARARKTGTTIVGLIYKDPNGTDGVVLGADTRATEGPIVAGKFIYAS